MPELQSDHDVLLAINYTGICGSDVHYWEHGAIGHYVVKDPMVLGHESAGTVVAVGSAVTTLRPGDRVAVEPGYPCRRCAYCLAGKYNLCADMRFAATPPYDGTLTGFWAAPADFCYRLPPAVPLQAGALMEPLAVAVHIARQARVAPGASVVVMGAGPVGLLCAAVARAFGARTVVSVDVVESKLAFARGFAATHTYTSRRVPPEENAQALLAVAGLDGSGGGAEEGPGADVVIEASGAEPSIQASVHAVRRGGTYVQAGMGRADITFPIMALCLKEVTALGSFRYGPGDYRLAVELVASGKIDVLQLVSETVGFGQAEAAFKKVKEGQVIKILIAGPNEEESKGTTTEKGEEEVEEEEVKEEEVKEEATEGEKTDGKEVKEEAKTVGQEEEKTAAKDDEKTETEEEKTVTKEEEEEKKTETQEHPKQPDDAKVEDLPAETKDVQGEELQDDATAAAEGAGEAAAAEEKAKAPETVVPEVVAA